MSSSSNANRVVINNFLRPAVRPRKLRASAVTSYPVQTTPPVETTTVTPAVETAEGDLIVRKEFIPCSSGQSTDFNELNQKLCFEIQISSTNYQLRDIVITEQSNVVINEVLKRKGNMDVDITSDEQFEAAVSTPPKIISKSICTFVLDIGTILIIRGYHDATASDIFNCGYTNIVDVTANGIVPLSGSSSVTQPYVLNDGDLSLTKSLVHITYVGEVVDSSTYQKVGDILTYKLTVSNTSNMTFSNFEFFDDFISKTANPVNVYSNNECTISNTVTTLAPGNTLHVYIPYTVRPDDITNCSITNSATIKADQQCSNERKTFQSNDVVTDLNLEGSLELVKSLFSVTDADGSNTRSDNQYLYEGDVIKYGFVITNHYNFPITLVRLTDPNILTGVPGVSDTIVEPHSSSGPFYGTYNVTADDMSVCTISNQATISATSNCVTNISHGVSNLVVAHLGLSDGALTIKKDYIDGENLQFTTEGPLKFKVTVENTYNLPLTFNVTDVITSLSESLFRELYPSDANPPRFGDNGPFEWGTRFVTKADGYITSIHGYTYKNCELNKPTIRYGKIWIPSLSMTDPQVMVAFPSDDTGLEAWQTAVLPIPYFVKSGTEVVVSYSVGQGAVPYKEPAPVLPNKSSMTVTDTCFSSLDDVNQLATFPSTSDINTYGDKVLRYADVDFKSGGQELVNYSWPAIIQPNEILEQEYSYNATQTDLDECVVFTNNAWLKDVTSVPSCVDTEDGTYDIIVPVPNVATRTKKATFKFGGTQEEQTDILIEKTIVSGQEYSKVDDEIVYQLKVINTTNQVATIQLYDYYNFVSDTQMGPRTTINEFFESPEATSTTELNATNNQIAANDKNYYYLKYTVTADDLLNKCEIKNLALVTGSTCGYIPVQGPLGSFSNVVISSLKTTGSVSITKTLDTENSTALDDDGYDDGYHYVRPGYLSYIVKVTNSTNLPISFSVDDVTSLNMHPLGSTPTSSTQNWSVIFLAAGSSTNNTFTTTVHQSHLDSCTIFTNVATLTAKFIPQCTFAPVTKSSGTVIVYPRFVEGKGLQLTKSIESGAPYTHAGDIIVYKYDLTNNTNETLTITELNDDNLDSPIFHLTPDCTDAITIGFVTIDPAETLTVYSCFTLRNGDLLCEVTNTASAKATYCMVDAPNDLQTLTSNPEYVTASLELSGTLDLTKFAFPTSFSSVGAIYYVVTVTNNTNVPLTNVMVSPSIGSVVIIPLPFTLAVLESKDVTITYMVTQADMNSCDSTLTQTISVSAESQCLDIPSPEDLVTTTPMATGAQHPLLSITKSCNDYCVDWGTVLTYTIVVCNIGNVDLPTVTVKDDNYTAIFNLNAPPQQQFGPNAVLWPHTRLYEPTYVYDENHSCVTITLKRDVTEYDGFIISNTAKASTTFCDYDVDVTSTIDTHVKPRITSFTYTSPTCGAQNGSITLTVEGATPFTFTLNESEIEADLNTSYTFSGLSGGTYTFTVTDGNGCETEVEPITLEDIPIIEITCEDIGTCKGTSLVLSPDVTGGTEPFTYSWTLGDQAIEVATSYYSPPTNEVGENTYTFTVTDVNGCVASCNIMVTVWDHPEILMECDYITCTGVPVTVDAVVTGGTAPYTYQWYVETVAQGKLYGDSDDVQEDGHIIFNPPVSTLGAFIYGIKVTDANGCTHCCNAIIIVLAGPSVCTGTTQTVCAGTSVTLGPATTEDETTVQWFKVAGGGDTLIGNENSITFNSVLVGQAGTYYYYAKVTKNFTGCKTNSTGWILIVNAKPAVPSLAVSENPACIGESVTFTLSNVATDSTIQWYKEAILLSGSSSTYTISNVSLADAVDYSAMVTNSSNCSSTSKCVSLNVMNCDILRGAIDHTDVTGCMVADYNWPNLTLEDGTSIQISTFYYTPQNGSPNLINSVSPGQMFYDVKLKIPAGTTTLQVVQTNNLNGYNQFFTYKKSGTNFYESSACSTPLTLTSAESVTSGSKQTTTFTFPNSTFDDSKTYIMHVKYDPSLAGVLIPSGGAPVKYFFNTIIGNINIIDTTKKATFDFVKK